ncbi:hypothetical protein HOD19_03710 [bacterium]|jgi:hypothetical protein|nr:hypothetical protein [bacterium]MBT4648919.1 hypothetical protein [bacterium]
MKDIIVLDLETKKTFDEVGGHQNNHLLGVSLVGVYSYNLDKYRGFKEEEFDELLDLLKEAGLVIGFNSKAFDFPVLQPYYKDFDLASIPHLDILEEVTKILGHRLKLDSVAHSTLGYGKSGSGLDAIVYYRNDEWDKLIKYCLDDVKVTKEIYDYGLQHGNIWYHNGGVKTDINASWFKSGEKTINQQVQEAWKDGQQIEISYMDEKGDVTSRKIDIQNIRGNKIKAFCHLRDALRMFDLDRVKSVKVAGKMQSFQKTLI